MKVSTGRTAVKGLFASILLATFVAPALAQTTAAEFYVVQDTSTKKCTIVDKKPTTTTTTTIASDGVFKTRVEAENAMKTVKVCESK